MRDYADPWHISYPVRGYLSLSLSPSLFLCQSTLA